MKRNGPPGARAQRVPLVLQLRAEGWLIREIAALAFLGGRATIREIADQLGKSDAQPLGACKRSLMNAGFIEPWADVVVITEIGAAYAETLSGGEEPAG